MRSHSPPIFKGEGRRGGVAENELHPTPHLTLYTSEIIGLEGQKQPAQGSALGTMVVCN
jgi:hypothetical protein